MNVGKRRAKRPSLPARKRVRARAARRPSRTRVQVKDVNGKVTKRITLPRIFETPIRSDVVRKVVVALQTHRFQPQGRDPMAGKRTSAKSVGVGRGLSRVPRRRDSTEAAFAPGTVGGRQAHPPVQVRKIRKKVNKKERLLALRSAIAATGRLELVAKRGHDTSGVKALPLVVDDGIQSLSRAKDVTQSLEKLGIWADVLRVERNIRPKTGKARLRGRARRVGKGPLIVIDEDKGVAGAAGNIPGVEIVRAKDLNAEALAPGAHLGRLTVWDSSTFASLDKRFLGAG